METEKLNLKLTIINTTKENDDLLQEATVLRQYLTSTSLDLTVKSIEEASSSNIVSKGDAVTLGALLLVVAPTILPQVLSFIEKMVIDKRKIEIEAPNGAKIVFTPDKKMTEDEILQFLKDVNKVKKTKK